jgi:hypothetical protein
MKKALQALIDEISEGTENIILGYGLCSMGVIGLKASHSTLVIPRLDDCIAVFLGSRKAYEDILAEEPGTYFLSRGWIEAGMTLLDELKMMEGRYGKTRADRLIKLMLKNYKRLVYVEMGNEGQGSYRHFSKKAAGELNLAYQEMKGSGRFLRKILEGPWDDEFILAPPGHTVSLEDFGMFSGDERRRGAGAVSTKCLVS